MKQKIQPFTLENLVDAIYSEYTTCIENMMDPDFNVQYLRGKIVAYRDVLSMLGKNNISLSIREEGVK